jgi:hypothetical protein
VEVDPGGQYDPDTGQGPVQELLVAPDCAPYRPAGQGTQAADAAGEYVPGGHRYAVALVEPAGQAYPARHGPEQVLLVSAAAAPK